MDKSYDGRREWLNKSFTATLDFLENQETFTSPTKTISALPEYLHPALIARCEVDFSKGDYANAVLKAFRYIEVRVRELADLKPTDVGTSLVGEAMKTRGGLPRIGFSKIEAEQLGFQYLFMGAISAYKNPLSHREVEYTDRGRALERLAFASMLLHELDDATITNPTAIT